jgi:hypothetical protein
MVLSGVPDSLVSKRAAPATGTSLLLIENPGFA